MKKYNKPEIVALALEMVDVIETSGGEKAAAIIGQDSEFTGENAANAPATVQVVKQQIADMSNKWSW